MPQDVGILIQVEHYSLVLFHPHKIRGRHRLLKDDCWFVEVFDRHYGNARRIFAAPFCCFEPLLESVSPVVLVFASLSRGNAKQSTQSSFSFLRIKIVVEYSRQTCVRHHPPRRRYLTHLLRRDDLGGGLEGHLVG